MANQDELTKRFTEAFNKIMEVRCGKCDKLIGRWIDQGYAEDPIIYCLECNKNENN